jgi:hypothetical protein
MLDGRFGPGAPGGLQVPLEVSTVTLRSAHSQGELEQNIEVKHPAGASEENIITAAFQLFLQIGGIMLDAKVKSGTMTFIPAMQLTKPVQFSVNRILVPTA